jgi:uncharacterized protein
MWDGGCGMWDMGYGIADVGVTGVDGLVVWYSSGMVDVSTIRGHREEILRIAARNRAANVRMFGSLARGKGGVGSDLDLLVRFEPGSSLMDHGMLVEELQALLGVRVDVVSEGAIAAGDRFGAELLREAVPL